MLQPFDPPVDRYGHPTSPTSIIHGYTSADEDMRLIRAYRNKHFGELTTVQIGELGEISMEAEQSKHERNV